MSSKSVDHIREMRKAQTDRVYVCPRQPGDTNVLEILRSGQWVTARHLSAKQLRDRLRGNEPATR